MGETISANKQTSAHSKNGVTKAGCPNGRVCIGEFCEWNHDAVVAKKDDKKGCPNGTECVGQFCEWNHDAGKKMI
jgi:hypothetical protein